MVSMLNSGWSGPGLSLVGDIRVALLGKAIHSQGASLYPGVQMSSVEFNDGVRVLGSCDGLTSHPRMSRNTHSHFMLQTLG